ncbi:hypothetical protein FQN50_009061 [Emmonsiellopsis sp. PD_5]|nr:hypothetical protein FQN50_009061 [Emmonsiellopsis sp. PD_5]
MPPVLSPTESSEPQSNDTTHSKNCEPPEPVISAVLGLPGDVSPASGGTCEVLAITKILETAGICCCLVGISALKYYGAGRVRHVSITISLVERPIYAVDFLTSEFKDWEICVPTRFVEKAAQIFESEPHTKMYQTYPPGKPQIGSLLHIFPRFKIKGVSLIFTIIPDEDAHLQCIPSNIERSRTGLPYPTLPVFAQSLVDVGDEVPLVDLIDGMDLSEGWGIENLDLDSTTDISWMEKKNQGIKESVPGQEISSVCELNVRCASKREIWIDFVRTKEKRIGAELPKEMFATRFRTHDDVDPRSRERNFV